jgi:peptidoglycan hydrolase-like protein with peptidoglycan-binding domain
MAGLSDLLRGGAPVDPPDEVLEMVQRVSREQKLREAGFGPEASGMGAFLKAAPTAGLGLGPPMPYSQTMPLKVAAGDDRDAVKALQRELKAKGYYTGPIDGKMEGGTAAAKRAFDAAEQQRSAGDLDRMKTENEAAKIAAERKAAEQKVVDRETGDAKLKKAEESLPWYSRAMRDWGQPAGIVAGGLAALLMRGKMVNKYNAGRAETAKSADDLMTGAPAPGTPVSQGNIGDRAGRVNEFWTTGQRGTAEQPFLSDPAAARGFRSNASAPQSADLYRPNAPMNMAKDAAIPAVGGIEYAGAHYVKGGAMERLDKANAAYNADPSDANLQALQKAKESVALYEGLERMGQATATVGLGTALLGGRVEKRPGTATADAERAAIDAYLAKAGGPPGGGPKLSGVLKQPPPLQLLAAPAPAPAPKPAVKGGSHPDHNWNEKAKRWQDPNDGNKFLTGPPPKG